jgi:anti-sigma B factor antagonist
MATTNRRVESGQWVENGPLTIRSEREPNELYVLELFGEFDLSSIQVAESELRRIEESGVKQIIVDLSGLDFIDSSGLRVLLTTYERERRGADRLVFLRGRGPVQRIMELTQLHSTLPFID